MDDEIRARRAACTDSFLGNGLGRPPELLASIGPDVDPDLYGDGGVVAALERYIAEVLGKPAAVFPAERHHGAGRDVARTRGRSRPAHRALAPLLPPRAA